MTAMGCCASQPQGLECVGGSIVLFCMGIGEWWAMESHRVPWGREGVCAGACLSLLGECLASGVVP